MNKCKIGDVIAIPEHQSLGNIIDMGTEPNGSVWYRTDAEGVREAHELVLIDSVHAFDFYLRIGYSIHERYIPEIKARLRNRVLSVDDIKWEMNAKGENVPNVSVGNTIISEGEEYKVNSIWASGMINAFVDDDWISIHPKRVEHLQSNEFRNAS